MSPRVFENHMQNYRQYNAALKKSLGEITEIGMGGHVEEPTSQSQNHPNEDRSDLKICQTPGVQSE